MSAFLALAQVISSVREKSMAKYLLWIFLLAPLFPYVVSTRAINNAQSSMVYSHEHPVDNLISNSSLEFTSFLERQSKTYEAAHDEYQRRYHVEPPAGFREWYEFAQSRQSVLIDDFDVMYSAIAPLWELSGQEVLEMMNSAQDFSKNELWRCQFSGRDAKTSCSHPHRSFDRNFQPFFDTILQDLGGALPDIKFLINHLDEPRVIFPPESMKGDPRSRTLNSINPSQTSAWEVLTDSCSLQESLEKVQTTTEVETLGLPFVTDIKSSLNLCLHPEYEEMHGIAQGPKSYRLFNGLVPILSTGSPSTMNDMLYPSASYMEREFTYQESHDIDWEDKRNNLYWAGSTTGGFATDREWWNFHRQRFVRLAQNLEKGQHDYIRERQGVLQRVKSSFFNGRLFDVALTRIIQCRRKACRDQLSYFHLKPWADKDRALKSQLVFDLDGNGISGRYYKLLASKSTPLKQTIFREWHDDRLFPWVHYIPISQSMEELPEIVSYLTSTEAGRVKAKQVADQGREWFTRAFREVDLTIYTYRLLLELARLQDPDRPPLK
ncbi:hypothetical protein N7512_000696 [Penicillium capsulatum]|nr:hypothetical protein N7512_000696 [Penicillium capsulatum]